MIFSWTREGKLFIVIGKQAGASDDVTLTLTKIEALEFAASLSSHVAEKIFNETEDYEKWVEQNRELMEKELDNE